MAVLKRESQDGVWTLAIARPPANAANAELVRELEAEVRAAEESAECRSLVLTGEGRAFCAGLDVKALPAYDAAERAELLRGINRTLARLYALPKPTVAAVQGHALGAGLVLALACDFRFAAEGAYQLGLTEVAAGIPFPAAPLAITKAELSRGLARKLVIGGGVFGPQDPAAREIFDAIVPAAELLAAARTQAERSAAQRAFAAVKEQLRRETIAALRAIAASGRDPLMDGWL